DGITTDGVYGRALLQLALELPVGIDPVFDSYRAAASIDHGDWDGLRRCLASSPVEPIQLLGMRNVLLAPLNQIAPRDPLSPYAMLFAPYEYQLNQIHGGSREADRTFASRRLAGPSSLPPAPLDGRRRHVPEIRPNRRADRRGARIGARAARVARVARHGGIHQRTRRTAPRAPRTAGTGR